MVEARSSRASRDGGILSSSKREQLAWLERELQAQSLIGFPVEGLLSHEQEHMATHGRSTCAIAAAQNADLLLRGAESSYQNRTVNEMIRLLPSDPFKRQPGGMTPRQLKTLLRTMDLFVTSSINASIPSIVTFLQEGIVIELGPEKHWRVIANVQKQQGTTNTNEAHFSVLDATPDRKPYDIPIGDFAERLTRSSGALVYLGVKLLPSKPTR